MPPVEDFKEPVGGRSGMAAKESGKSAEGVNAGRDPVAGEGPTGPAGLGDESAPVRKGTSDGGLGQTLHGNGL